MCYCDHDEATCRRSGHDHAYVSGHDHAYAKRIADAMPKWFWWYQWGLAIGSDDRYKPRWYERRAYAAGLQDAARIVEAAAWEDIPKYWRQPADGSATRRAVDGFADLRGAIIKIHEHAMRFMRSVYFPEL